MEFQSGQPHKFKAGRPSILNDDLIKEIINAVPKVYIPSQIAGLIGVAPRRLNEWLQWGKDDLNLGKDSVYAQLALEYNHKRAEIAQELIRNMRWYFKQNVWILKKAFRKDFGQNDDERKFYELIAAKLAKAGIKIGDYESFLEETEFSRDQE